MMKRLLTLCTTAILFLIYTSVNAQKETKITGKEDKANKDQGIELPYKATLSSQWSISNVKNANTVLTIMKAIEINNFSNIGNLFADNFQFAASDGRIIKGKDEYLSQIKQIRGSLNNVKTSIAAYMPVHSIDKNEDAVLVWGTNEFTDNIGNNQKLDYHWFWFLDQIGKVIFLRDYTSKPNSPQ